MGEILMEQSKYIAVLLGLLAGFPLVWKRRARLGLKDAWQVGLLCLAYSTFSVAAALVFAGVESLLSGEGFRLGAISTYGVYFFCPVFLLLLARALKKPGREWMDVFALYALPSLFLLRINCLISGCCGGRQIGSTGLHWPTREAEMVFYGILLLVLLRRERTGAQPGTAFPLLTAAYGAFRFMEEWFRTGTGGSLLHLAHGWSVLACILGLGFYFECNAGYGRAKARYGERSAWKC